MAENSSDIEKVRDIIKSTKIAMLTHVSHEGKLVSKPMGTQEVDFDGTVRFIAQLDNALTAGLQERPEVNVAYSGSGSWLSLSGKARVVNDEAKLKQLWNSFNGSWVEGGPEDPNNVLIEVDVDTAEYWDAPGSSKIAQVANLVKSKVSGERIQGENKVVDL